MRILIPALLAFSLSTLNAQETVTNKTGSKYTFKTLCDLQVTDVKDQCKTSYMLEFQHP